MILLVVGLVAVIVVIVIAVFLSIRLGRSDEHDDEPDISASSRDQWAEEDHWRESGASGARRSPRPSRAGRGSAVRHDTRDDDRRRSGEPAYSGTRERDHAGRARDRDYAEGPPQRTRREPAEYQSSSARRRPAVPAAAESRGRYDTSAPRRAPADDYPDDYPSGDYPDVDFPADDYAGDYTGQYAAADHDDYTVAGYPAAGYPDDGGRPDSRRPAAPAPPSGKSRSRQHRGKRADADDWPSSEWDKLSDEQYWAELSSDKPLATMARPAQPASTDREQGRGRRNRSERPPPQREAATEHLPVRSRPPVPAARPAAQAPADSRPVPAGTHPSLDTGTYPVLDGGRHPSLDTAFPAPGGSRHPSLDTMPRPARDPGRRAFTGPPGPPAPPVPGALEDDPLTSPSFSLKADPVTDSRSYGHPRKAPRAPASDPMTGTGAGHASRRRSRSYPPGGYSSPGHGYPAEPAPGAAAAPWYGSPTAEPAPGYADPYHYPAAPGTGSPELPAGDAGYDGYLADPLRVYSPPGYQPPASPAYPGPPRAPYQDLPSPEAAAPDVGPGYPGAYPEPPYGPGPGHLDPPQYPRGPRGSGYAPSYGSDPYAPGDYGVYPPQG